MATDYSDDIKRIARERQNKKGLATSVPRPKINGDIKPFPDINGDGSESNDNSGLVSPVTLEILTSTTAEMIEANNGDFKIKHATTAKITDAAGTEIFIDQIIRPIAP